MSWFEPFSEQKVNASSNVRPFQPLDLSYHTGLYFSTVWYDSTAVPSAPAIGGSVGLFEGNGVGAGVGFLEGNGVSGSVGSLEGSGVGSGVGKGVGAGVGLLEGSGVGKGVGLLEGEGEEGDGPVTGTAGTSCEPTTSFSSALQHMMWRVISSSPTMPQSAGWSYKIWKILQVFSGPTEIHPLVASLMGAHCPICSSIAPP
mmetsp:Transcript_2172/g.4131  ORF Transcript_2172/g.4131 Transcript_2172/m.4131 type:complete len:201 (+) Transcript_2172:1561-2163(+)